MLTAITGVNWGDEGKGRMVDLLSEQYDIVVRYQGGNNAGHTVINEKGKFILNLLPSGILRETTVNVMGNGMVIDLEHLVHEIENLRRGGIAISPENLKISERAVICMPYHKLLDCYEEDRLADAKYGSTRRGIAPVYGDKYTKKALRMGDLFHPETTKARLADIVAYKNLTIEGVYGRPPVSADDMWAWLVEYGDILKPYICDAGLYLDKAAKAGKNILFEAQLGLEQDVFPRFGRFVQIQPSVADIRLEDVAVFHEPRPHIIRADRRPSVHALYGEIFVGHDIRQARFCRLRVEQIAHAQGLFRIFVAVNGCDAAACGAVFRIRKTVLLVAVQQLVVRHADDRPL